MKPKIGDRVIVDASAIGDGIAHVGVIEDITTFLHTTYVYVHFHDTSSLGVCGVTLTNLELIQKIDL